MPYQRGTFLFWLPHEQQSEDERKEWDRGKESYQEDDGRECQQEGVGYEELSCERQCGRGCVNLSGEVNKSASGK